MASSLSEHQPNKAVKLTKRRKFIILVCLTYFIAGITWIFLTDKFLLLFTDISTLVKLSSTKGILFIILTTAFLLFTLINIPEEEVETARRRGYSYKVVSFAGAFPRWLSYFFAIIVTCTTLWLRMQLQVDWQTRPMLIMFMLPIILSAALGGVGPGILATIIAALTVDYWCIPPVHSLAIRDSHDLFQWTILVADGVMVSLLSGLFFRALRQAREKTEVQRLTQEALLESEEKFRTVADNIYNWEYWSGVDGRLIYVSPSCERITGYTDHEFYEDPGLLTSIIHPEDRGHFERHLVELPKALSGKDHNLDFRIRHKSGEIRWIAHTCKEVFDKEHTRLGRHISNMDITERKHAEQALRESELKFSELFHQVGDSIYIADGAGNIIAANNHASHELGYSLEELTQLHIEDIDNLASNSDKVSQELEYAMAAGAITIDTEHRTKDGSIIPVEVKIRAVDSNNGKIVIGVARNLSERKQNEETRLQLEKQLFQAQKMESVGQLAGGVAHDFNNMLSVILGHSELALDEIGKTHPAYDDLQEIRGAAHRSADIVRQLLAFARKQIVTPKIINLNEVVASMLKMLRRLIGEDIELVWKPGKDLWQIRIDPSQVDQILANLCVNARDAIEGSGTITVITENVEVRGDDIINHLEATPGDYVMLQVSDTGAGIPQEIKTHIFEPFFTTKVVGKGTGLGLSTVYGAVSQNNGFIAMETAVGQGTTFKLFLPRVVRVTQQLDDSRFADIKRGKAQTILLVEDEPQILSMISAMLRNLEYQVLPAALPDVALALAKDHPGVIDLVITDVIMPGLSGKELVERLRQTRPGVRYLFMSGYTADIVGSSGILEEGMAFIHKPFTKVELADKIHTVLSVT